MNDTLSPTQKASNFSQPPPSSPTSSYYHVSLSRRKTATPCNNHNKHHDIEDNKYNKNGSVGNGLYANNSNSNGITSSSSNRTRMLSLSHHQFIFKCCCCLSLQNKNSYNKKQIKILLQYTFITLIFVFITFRVCVVTNSTVLQSSSFHSVHVNTITPDDLLIQRFSTSTTSSSYTPSFNFPPPLTSRQYRLRKLRPDYGEINYTPISSDQTSRYITEVRDIISGEVYTSSDFANGEDDAIDNYYAFDDDRVRHPYCQRTEWHRYYFPNCNFFHELELLDVGRIIGAGFYRDVWSTKDTIHHYLPESDSSSDNSFEAVIKSMRYNHEYNHEHFEFTRMDALVMERLSSAKRIVDIYGHCAVSVMTEAITSSDIEPKVVPGSGMIEDEKKDLRRKKQSKDVDIRNDYTVLEKLQIALEMSEAIAELHGFKDGVIVHDDVQLCQFLRAKDGTLKLNDFNRAEVMLFDPIQQKYCKYRNGKVYGNYRAPEEMNDFPLDEKIDVWSLGNNFYGLLTGLWIFYYNEDDQVVQEKVMNKETAYIDPRFRRRSFPEWALVTAMERCWIYNPDKRVDIFTLVEFLGKAFDHYTVNLGYGNVVGTDQETRNSIIKEEEEKSRYHADYDIQSFLAKYGHLKLFHYKVKNHEE